MANNIEKLIAQREEIDRQLKEHFEKEVAVLFTDIVGSTEYFERKGDIEGLALVVRHNNLLFPIVERHGGRIVKTIGDAIMAVFEDPPAAVHCAADMQRALARYRQETPSDEIRIRIGAHVGAAMAVDGDVYGDAVNTAARIAGKADSGEVLISADLFATVPAGTGFAVRPSTELELKGKAEPVEVVSLEWRVAETAAPPAEPTPEQVVLELTVGGSGLRVAALDGAHDKGTVKTYAEVPLALDELGEVGARLESYLRGGADSYLDRIRELGAELFSSALSERAREVLSSTRHSFLRLQVDDDLAHVPWELMHDGDEFLGLRFSVGRLVAARADVSARAMPTNPGVRGRAVVVSNPTGDLEHAAREGDAVAGLLRDGFRGEVVHLRGPIGRADFLEALRSCWLLHFAGHAIPPRHDDPGGFRFADGVVSPDDLRAPLTPVAPTLVFANSCYASIGRGWSRGARGTYDLAAALLLLGVRHYLGPLGDIPDQDAVTFALRFYEHALSREPLGKAVRDGRRGLTTSAAEPISFAGYVFYGDPRTRFAEDAVTLTRGRTRALTDTGAASLDAAPPARAAKPTSQAVRSRRSAWIGAGLAVAVGVAGLVAWKALAPPAPKKQTADAPPAAAAARTGPVRLSVLPFKNLNDDQALAFLSGGLVEATMTELAGAEGIELVERIRMTDDDLDRDAVLVKDILGEIRFGRGGLVDESTAARLGKLRGVEVLLVGGFQRNGDVVRATTRFVDVESGRVLDTLKVDGQADDTFGLQDRLAAQVRDALPRVRATVRGR